MKIAPRPTSNTRRVPAQPTVTRRLRWEARRLRDLHPDRVPVIVSFVGLVVVGAPTVLYAITGWFVLGFLANLAPLVLLWPAALAAAWLRMGAVDRAMRFVDKSPTAVTTAAAVLASAGFVGLSLLAGVTSNPSRIEVAAWAVIAVNWGATATLASVVVVLMPPSWRLSRSATATVAVVGAVATPVLLATLAWQILSLL